MPIPIRVPMRNQTPRQLSVLSGERVEVSRLYEDGFLLLKDDPGRWIQSNPGGCLSSVRSLELHFSRDGKGRIGDCIGELSQLTHLCIIGKYSLKCLPNTISRLQNLRHLELRWCLELQELPDLENLTSLTLNYCRGLRSLPNSVVAKLKTLNLTHSGEELPTNLNDLESLTTLILHECNSLRSLPRIITKLSKLRLLYLPSTFRLGTLPPDLDDSIIISVDDTHIRKTWKELKVEMQELFSIQFPFIPVELAEKAAHKTSTPGYLRLKGDPKPWIQVNYGLHSLVRILDLELEDYKFQGNIADFIGELPQLTHLYISYGWLHHLLPLAFTRITHLSLNDCTFKCDTGSHFDSLGKLSNLVSLCIQSKCRRKLPKHMDLPISLRHLTLQEFHSVPSSYMASMAKLSNLETLNLHSCINIELLPLNLNITKLMVSCTSIKSLPVGLKHLEIIKCSTYRWNQLVNLETLSFTCYEMKSLTSVTSLHNLQELQLKDCFSLKQLPSNLYKLVNLCTLNVSGTRIESLPNTLIKLRKLRHLILPKCFDIKSLPHDFETNVLISVDDTDESYYKHRGYHRRKYGIISEDDYMTSDYIKEINEMFLKKHRQNPIIEGSHFTARKDRMSNNSYNEMEFWPPENEDGIVPSVANTLQGHALIEIQGSHFVGSTHPVSNNKYNSFSSSQDHEIENLPTRIEDGTVQFSDERFSNHQENTRPVLAAMEFQNSQYTGGSIAAGENNPYSLFNLQNQEDEALPSTNKDCVVTPVCPVHEIAAGPRSQLHETIPFAENNQEALQIGRMDNRNSGMDQGFAQCSSVSVAAGSNYPALEIEQDKIAQSGKLKNKTQKIEITRESILQLMSQGIRLVDAAEQLKVSRSTMKRALAEYDITWPSSRKRKLQDANKNKKHNIKSSCGRNSLQLNSADHSNLAGYDHHMLEHLDGPNQLSLSNQIPSEPDVVNESTSHEVIRTVGEPPMSTQCHTDGHQHVKEHLNSVKECAVSNTIQSNESCSTFDVKATYNEDTVRFYFSLRAGFEQLKEELGKRFELEVGKFKMYYQDDEKDWLLMACISDLERALHFSKSSGSNVVRLSIKLRKNDVII